MRSHQVALPVSWILWWRLPTWPRPASAQARRYVGQADSEQAREIAVRRPVPMDIGRNDREDDQRLKYQPHRRYRVSAGAGFIFQTSCSIGRRNIERQREVYAGPLLEWH
jgi:hypothetical protein